MSSDFLILPCGGGQAEREVFARLQLYDTPFRGESQGVYGDDYPFVKRISRPVRVARFILFQPFRIVADTENIIHRHPVKIRKPDQYFRRNVSLPEFVVAVNLLRAMQRFRQFPLRQIPILTQITYPLIDCSHLPPFCSYYKKLQIAVLTFTANCSIMLSKNTVSD